MIPTHIDIVQNSRENQEIRFRFGDKFYVLTAWKRSFGWGTGIFDIEAQATVFASGCFSSPIPRQWMIPYLLQKVRQISRNAVPG